MRTRITIAVIAAMTMMIATLGLSTGVASAELVDPGYPSGSTGINGPGTKGITDGVLLPVPGGESLFESGESGIQIGGLVAFIADYGADAAKIEVSVNPVIATMALNGATEVVAEFGVSLCPMVGTQQSVFATVYDAAGAMLYSDVLSFSPTMVSDPANLCGGGTPPVQPPVLPPPPVQPPAPVVVPVAQVAAGYESTGHIVTAEDGFSSLVNGNTAGDVAHQATDITPKQGHAAAPAAAAKELAYTGSESVYFVYAGLGLIAAGAVAMGSRRRLHTVADER